MTLTWQPYREPLRVTLFRTVTIALVVGAVLARSWGGIARWPMATLLALWPSFGGHWVELWFLNWLRPRISRARGVQVAARVAAWFIGGVVLALGMGLTAVALGFPPARANGLRSAWGHAWWVGGVAFIGIELVVHVVLHLRGRPSFYSGHG